MENKSLWRIIAQSQQENGRLLLVSDVFIQCYNKNMVIYVN